VADLYQTHMILVLSVAGKVRAGHGESANKVGFLDAGLLELLPEVGASTSLAHRVSVAHSSGFALDIPDCL
jgi:hypothetical protein